ncbi:MAG: apolipoprotein N-acyltransferase [Alkalispirochaetaceae bacterium]
MVERTEYRLDRFRVAGLLFLFTALAELALAVSGPFPLTEVDLRDTPFFLMLGVFYLLGISLLLPRRSFRRARVARLFFLTELLLAYSVLLFLFDYIFAANANMDYVQRFIESGGNLRLTLDTTTERAIAAARYGPFILLSLLLHLYLALRLKRFGMLATLLSVILTVLSYPSAADLDGFALLGWFSLTPLIYVLWRSSYPKILLYGVSYGVLATLLSNYWLGTFSLVSLLAVVVIFLGFYTLFMVPFGWVVLLLRRRGAATRTLATAAGWTLFELARSSGFLGYPWVLVAHSQYRNLPLIQISEVTGVWGVSFLLVLVATLLAELVAPWLSRLSRLSRHPHRLPGSPASLRQTALLVGLFVVAAHIYGTTVLLLDNRYPPADETVRVALIQQNSDPRKHEYERTLDSLIRLTDEALLEEPDIVVWSETAFVPNIRRWGEEDPRRYRLARLVREFRSYQESTGAWLLTGNDDYRRILDEEGNEIDRLSYNAAVLFSDEGERRETYHKIKLVPFTEHFPFREQLPGIYAMLEEFDVHFWEPGEERTVFQHPKFTFSTPICFEDVFPDQVRRFVLAGSEVILNITNDYWSLTEVQAKQHFVASLFRAVENRRPFLRATASGVTAHVDPYGRIVATRPQYREEHLVTDVPVSHRRTLTPYTRLGDWFPRAAALLLLLLLGFEVFRRLRRGAGQGAIDNSGEVD